MRVLVLLLFISFRLSVFGQSDTTVVLTFDEYYSLVINNHPIVKQSELLTADAAMELRLARGSFDPKLEGNWNFKEFKDSDYYNKLDVSLKIPTWFPINPVVGVERNLGDNLNPENFISETTDYQQVYAGVSVPIGQGLFIDQRRATIRQAQLLQEMAEAEQIKAINKILLTATKDYWEWYFAYNNYELLQRSIVLAQDIFDRTKMAHDFGEASPIDTVQAKINLLNRITAMQQANVDRIKAGLNLANHLWTANGAPLELELNVIPEQPMVNMLSATLLSELLSLALENHPELRKLDLKNQSLMVDRRLARENIKPKLNLNYYLLDQPFDYEGNSNDIIFDENYKVGVEFAFPIFLRKERAKLSQTNIKLEQNSFQLDFTERQVMNDINAQYNEAVTTASILQQQQEMVNNYELLLTAERLNLENGESDLFKLNVQMDKLIESQSKLLKLKSNYQKDVATLYWAAGVSNLGRN
ncbi:MAG: TolC family protein [Fulvivirga sp.]|uniref:TolC family protein n=1 Tax=Fulvivirga sp. TaxID=1931237 RepID=UPI0032EE13E3